MIARGVQRLVLAAGLASAACGDPVAAQPQPSAGPVPPPVSALPVAVPPVGWVPQPALADAVRRAPGPVATAYGSVVAWGEPAAGCFALWTTTQRTARASLAAERRDLEQALAPLGVGALPPLPAGATTWTATVDAALPDAGLRGQLSLTLGVPAGAPGTVVLDSVACLHNAREPRFCAAQCAPLLGTAAPRPPAGAPAP